MIFRTKWKSRLARLLHFFPLFSNLYKYLKSCCRQIDITWPGMAVSTQSCHSSEFSLMFGPGGCWLMVHFTNWPRWQQGGLVFLLELGNTRKGWEFVTRICCWNAGASTRTVFTTKPLALFYLGPVHTYLVRGTWAHHRQGRKGFLLVCPSREKRNGKTWGQTFSIRKHVQSRGVSCKTCSTDSLACRIGP